MSLQSYSYKYNRNFRDMQINKVIQSEDLTELFSCKLGGKLFYFLS